MSQLSAKIFRVLSSPWFFTAIMVLFVVESVWLAISAAYPMVFDENTQFGVIQLYAHHIGPVFLRQPPHAGFAGALTRQPSYLYQYLMSFPYRLLGAVTSSQMIRIIGLRFIDIALFGSSLVLFRRLFQALKLSPTLSHLALLFFVLLPVVPLLAGQINYDNLLMPVTAGVLLLALSVHESLTRHKRLPFTKTAWLVSLCLLGGLVQYEFLPILTAVIVGIGWQVWRLGRHDRNTIGKDLHRSWRGSNWKRRLLVGLPLIISISLFVEMYGVNLVAYHNLIPPCGQVMSIQQCAGYAPWQRNYAASLHKISVDTNPLRFALGWAYRMSVGLFYTSSGGARNAYYVSVNPLPTIFIGAGLLFALGVVLTILYRRVIFDRYHGLKFLLFVIVVYVISLWLRNYHDFINLGQKVAINGRYLLPVALPVIIIIGLAYQQWMSRWPNYWQLAALVLTLLIFSQGGGALTYIVDSNPAWYWQTSSLPMRLNRAAQRIVKPFILIKTPLHSIDRYEHLL